MPRQIQKPTPQESQSDKILAQMNEQLAQNPVTFEGETGRQKLSGASDQASNTLGNIDDVLAENDAANARDGAAVQSRDGLTDKENVNAPWTTDMGDKSDDNQQPNKLQGAVNGLKSKKGIIGGIGIGGGLAGIALSFSLLLPLKIVGLIDSAANKMGAEVEHVVETRAEKLVVRKIESKYLSTLALTASDGPFAAIRTSMLERRLADKGITFAKDGAGGMEVRYNGRGRPAPGRSI